MNWEWINDAQSVTLLVMTVFAVVLVPMIREVITTLKAINANLILLRRHFEPDRSDL